MRSAIQVRAFMIVIIWNRATSGVTITSSRQLDTPMQFGCQSVRHSVAISLETSLITGLTVRKFVDVLIIVL